MKRTPGPWHTDDSKSFYVFAAGSMAEQAGVEHGPFIANCSTQANARFVAVAPQMFEALSELVAEFDRMDAEASNEPGHFGLNESFGITLARDAIRKAEGI